MYQLLIACALFAVFSFPTAVLAQNNNFSPIGTIATVEGSANITHNGTKSTAEAGQDIYLNDILETGVDSKALVLFIDNTEIALSENSQLDIDEYVFDEEASDSNKGRFSILRGAFLLTSGLINKNKKPDVEISTSYGSIGIRGTIVWGGQIDEEYNVFVQEGEVNFNTDRGRVILRPGQGSKVHSRRALPSRAKAWGEAKIKRATQTVALKNEHRVRQNITNLKKRHQKMRQEHRDAIHGKIKDHEHREEYKEKHEERIEEFKEERREERREVIEEIKEKRSDRIDHETKKEIRERLRGGDTPQEIEIHEKRHIKRNIQKRIIQSR